MEFPRHIAPNLRWNDLGQYFECNKVDDFFEADLTSHRSNTVIIMHYVLRPWPTRSFQ